MNVKKAEPVKIDDQFAKNLGAKDLNDLKELVGKQVKNQYKLSIEALSKENILNQIEKLHEIDLPDNLVQQELSLISQGLKNQSKLSQRFFAITLKLGIKKYYGNHMSFSEKLIVSIKKIL